MDKLPVFFECSRRCLFSLCFPDLGRMAHEQLFSIQPKMLEITEINTKQQAKQVPIQKKFASTDEFNRFFHDLVHPYAKCYTSTASSLARSHAELEHTRFDYYSALGLAQLLFQIDRTSNRLDVKFTIEEGEVACKLLPTSNTAIHEIQIKLIPVICRIGNLKKPRCLLNATGCITQSKANSNGTQSK
jgi:hypothetical protein